MTHTTGAPIQAVLFDYGNVLYAWDALVAIVGRVPLPTWHAFTDSGAFSCVNEMCDAGASEEEMAQALRAAYPDHPEWEEAHATYLAHFMDSLTGPIPGTAAVVTDLAEAGIPLYLLSNFNDRFFQAQRHLTPVLEHFTGLAISGEMHLTKPDPQIFTATLERFGLDPATTLFVDDSHRNIEAAAALGIRTHLFTTAGALRAHLHEEGLLPAS